MNKAVICIGSNENKEVNIPLCAKLLHEVFNNIMFSDTVNSSPYGEIYKTDFINQLAYILTYDNLDEVSAFLKNIEEKMGRQPEHKLQGRVVIDIDILSWNNEVLKPEDLEREYVKLMTQELANNINNKKG